MHVAVAPGLGVVDVVVVVGRPNWSLVGYYSRILGVNYDDVDFHFHLGVE